MKCKYKKFLKAAYINYEEDYCGYGSGMFTKPTVTTPIIVITGATAIIACAISGATIYYTLDGSTPTSSSTLYTGAITLTLSCTVKAIAVKPGMSDSAVASERYVHYLTQWKIVGNSEVHTDPYLTSWKVSGNSEVHTLPYPDGVVLPTGYKRCEYLEGDGTAYIELPFGFDKTDEVYAKAAMLDITHTDKYFISPKVWNDNFNRFGLGTLRKMVNGVAYFMFAISYGGSGGVLEPNFVADIDIHEWEYKNYVASVGDSSKNVSSVRFDLETQNLRLFYGYNTPTECKIYEYRHKKANAEYRLIPCLDSNDTPCMYDVINNQAYYNSAESGSFTYKLYPQPTEIWSCGDLEQDGKYHVKISNGAAIYDIPLDAPLRKVNDVADTIEFPSETEGKALVTRYLASEDMGDMAWANYITDFSNKYRCTSSSLNNVIKRPSSNDDNINTLTIFYDAKPIRDVLRTTKGIGVSPAGFVSVYDENYDESNSAAAFALAIQGVELIYELATPTTELIDVSPFHVSPTDTYTSANVVPYSAFEHTENKEIWSCGEYNATDGKYHILVQPLGGSIADIALNEPLRKVNNIADTIEFPSDTEGKAIVTRSLGRVDLGTIKPSAMSTNISGKYRFSFICNNIKAVSDSSILGNVLCATLSTRASVNTNKCVDNTIAISTIPSIMIYKEDYANKSAREVQAFLVGVMAIYELATPTTELVDAPQIQEADSYSMVISQGGKAVSWSSFTTE